MTERTSERAADDNEPESTDHLLSVNRGRNSGRNIQAPRNDVQQQCSIWIKVPLVLLAIIIFPTISIVRTTWRIRKSNFLEKSADILQNTSRFASDYCSTERVNITSGGYFRFTGIIYDLLSGLHWIELLLIIYGFYCFCDKFKFKKQLRKKVIEFICQHYCCVFFTCSREHCCCGSFTCSRENCEFFTRICKHCCYGSLILVILVIYSGVALATPILSIRHAHGVCADQADLSCNTWNERIYRITVVHEAFTIFLRPVFILIRFTMVIAVVAVYIIWFEYYRSCDTESKYDSYTKRKDMVVPILKIYQQWFVVQWLIYYIALFTDITTLLRPLVTHTEETLSTCSKVQIGLHIGYTVLSFAIPYLCGLKMTGYHKEYYNNLVKEILKGDELTRQALAHVLSSEKDREPRCDFVPHIQWTGTGLSIPIDGPGFTIGSLITIFAIATAIVGFS